ncbi:GLE1-domain-containing protein [Coemansia reversa NRRL 1564]|uniref:mRNA export factor GLE1 n=1 Tax=Coemansia reversa (strain ATCC 12441 / NRRL 1564) TaxID=763665 RepID=A0A2G5B476_COERN|nr:GLE1-domain-containing protein [Coemansia reversa NRRL 1564]|eukprot:PIA13809.1 GLE1-domain-containing protein [Coemansia reversa NRRL 1564]
MKYGLFLLDESIGDTSTFSAAKDSSVLLSDGSVSQTTRSRKGSFIHTFYNNTSSPVPSTQILTRTPHSALERKFSAFKAATASEAVVSPLFDRRRRSTLSTIGNVDIKSASTLTRGKVRSWKMYARRSLGAPFPIASSPLSASKPQADSATYSKGDRYRELAEKANIRLRRSSTSVADTARTTACQAYARPIHKELEETRLFLENVSITPSATTGEPLESKSEIDSSVADTLAKVEQMRRDFYQRRKQEKEEKAKAKKLLEDQQKQREDKERKQKDAANKAKSKTETRTTLETNKAAPTPTTLPKPEVSNSSTQLHASSTDAAQEWAKKYRQMYRVLMDELAPQIKRNKTKSSYCFRQRGLVTRGIGQLKDSWDFICRTADNIKNIIAESSQQGDDVQRWMLNLVAKVIVKQAEKEVAVAHHAAFPLAAATVLVMQTYPQLLDMLLLRLVKKCPYIIPEYAAKSPSQSTTEYMRSIGYKDNGDEIESRELYSERMAGMIALFAAILQTNDIGGIPNPLPLKYGWSWLARIINLPPREISPLLVQTFLSIAGPAMLTIYGRQMIKILNLLAEKWTPAIPVASPGAVAAKSNLTGYLDDYHNTAKLNECIGRHIKTR